MFRRLLRVTGAVLVIAAAFVTPVLATSSPASADTVVNGCTIVSNPTPTSFTNCPGADLSGANLSGVDLSFANLSGAFFVGCSQPAGPCVAADLSQANLTDANLSSAAFSVHLNISVGTIASAAASLAGATLSGADLSSANLEDVNLTGATMTAVSATEAQFGGAKLTDADLTKANLTQAVFSYCGFLVCFPGCVNCVSAVLSGANLTDAILTDADLERATLTGAILSGATLTGANLSGTLLLPSDQTVSATSLNGAVVTWPPPPSLPGATPGTCTPPLSGSTFPIGATTITCQVLDDHGDLASGTFTITVNPIPTTTSLSSSPDPSLQAQQVTYTATVSPTPDSGTVGFSDNGTLIAGCENVPVSGGSASCSTTPSIFGAQTIVATYGGSADFAVSTAQLAQVVTQLVKTSVLVPAAGAGVVGDSWLDAAASSSAGIASVSFELSGGPNNVTDTVISGSTATLYGFLGAWNSTTVSNGTYTLQSIATDKNGLSTTSTPITITVNNPSASTSVIIPSDGGIQTGTSALLDAAASADVTGVSFELSGTTLGTVPIPIATATPTLYGWLAQWDSTFIPNGTYTLQSVGTTGPGVTVTSNPITVTVSN